MTAACVEPSPTKKPREAEALLPSRRLHFAPSTDLPHTAAAAVQYVQKASFQQHMVTKTSKMYKHFKRCIQNVLAVQYYYYMSTTVSLYYSLILLILRQ